MKAISTYIYIILTSIIFVSCSGKPFMPTEGKKPYSDEYCNALMSDIEIYTLRYEKTQDKKHLYQALGLLDSALNYCNNKSDIVEEEYYIYLLMKDYEKGIRSFERMDPAIFSPQYTRTYFINTFRSIAYNSEGDTVKRNEVNREICSEIEQYFEFQYHQYFQKDSGNSYNINKILPSILKRDKLELMRYYFVRARYESIEQLIKELKSVKVSDMESKDYLDNIILTLSKMNEKQGYHIEYNI